MYPPHDTPCNGDTVHAGLCNESDRALAHVLESPARPMTGIERPAWTFLQEAWRGAAQRFGSCALIPERSRLAPRHISQATLSYTLSHPHDARTHPIQARAQPAHRVVPRRHIKTAQASESTSTSYPESRHLAQVSTRSHPYLPSWASLTGLFAHALLSWTRSAGPDSRCASPLAHS